VRTDSCKSTKRSASKIDCIYIAACSRVRFFYPHIPIRLLIGVRSQWTSPHFLEVDTTPASISLDPAKVTVEPRWRSLYNWLNLTQTSRVRKISKLAFGRMEQARTVREKINRFNRSGASMKDKLPATLYDALIRYYAQDIDYLSDLPGIDFTNRLSARDSFASTISE
jgi:hypothetical protein